MEQQTLPPDTSDFADDDTVGRETTDAPPNCEDCQKPIPTERLRAIMNARVMRCLKCQREFEAYLPGHKPANGNWEGVASAERAERLYTHGQGTLRDA